MTWNALEIPELYCWKKKACVCGLSIVHPVTLLILNENQVLSSIINFIDQGAVHTEVDCQINPDLFRSLRIDERDLLNLCGGVPVDNLKILELSIRSPFGDALKVEVNTDRYKTARVINFYDRLIYNEALEVFTPHQGIGTKLLCNQIKKAREMGFRSMETTAMGPDFGGSEWNGYYTWGRLGFLMDYGSNQEFLENMRALKRTESSLSELLATNEGREIWKIVGFTWQGKFDLSNESLSLELLRNYLSASGKNYGI